MNLNLESSYSKILSKINLRSKNTSTMLDINV